MFPNLNAKGTYGQILDSQWQSGSDERVDQVKATPSPALQNQFKAKQPHLQCGGGGGGIILFYNSNPELLA